MAQFCEMDDCRLKDKPIHRLKFQGGKWRGEECGCARNYRIRSTINVFELTLDHVHDSMGNKVQVENLRQLRQAEKTYGFEHVMANYDGSNAHDPPQQRQVSMSDLYKRKFAR